MFVLIGNETAVYYARTSKCPAQQYAAAPFHPSGDSALGALQPDGANPMCGFGAILALGWPGRRIAMP